MHILFLGFIIYLHFLGLYVPSEDDIVHLHDLGGGRRQFIG